MVLFFDLETSGINPIRNAVTQISACAVSIDEEGRLTPLEAINLEICPRDGKEVIQKAIELQGLTTEELPSRLEDSVAFGKFLAFLSRHIDRFDKRNKFSLCGFGNIKFCTPFLRGWFDDNCDGYFGAYFYPEEIDLKVEATKKLLFKRPFVKSLDLGTVASAFGIPFDSEKTHNSKYDLGIICKLFQKINQSSVPFLPSV